MKYILKRQKFLVEKISWLDNRLSNWDQQFSELIMSFHDNILQMIDELKDKFNDKDDPIEVHKIYLEYFEKSFDSLIEKIRVVKDDDNLERLWRELILNFSLWKDTFKKMSENIDNYNSIFKLGYEIFHVLNRYLTKNKSNEYYDLLKGEIDDQREKVINFLEEVQKDLNSRILDIDPEQIFDMSNLDEKETDELNLNPGDEVRYYKNDDEENIAIISHNQDELKEKDNVRLVSKQSGEQFEIDKSEIIEIIPKHKTLNQEVSDKLKHIKKDPEKLDKLNDYLTDLEKTDEKLKDAYTGNNEYYFLVTEDEEWLVTRIEVDKSNFKNVGEMISKSGGISFIPTDNIENFGTIEKRYTIYENKDHADLAKDLLISFPMPIFGKGKMSSLENKDLGLTNQFNYKIVSYKPGSVRTDNINFFMKENNNNNDLQQQLFDNDDQDLLTITDNQAKRWLSNPNFKKKHIKLIDKMLKDVYQPEGYWKKYQFWGVMDLPWEENKWSLLNKINTNYSCLAILINEINRALVEGNSKIPLFDFRNKKDGTREFYQEYERLMRFVDKNKKKIFLKLTKEDGSQIINKMVNKINATTKGGDRAEGLVSRYIKYIFRDAKNIRIPKGGGERQDMIGGTDITFDINGDKKTVQVKKSKGIFKEEGKYRIVGLSLSKHYDVDYIACVSKYYMYFFEYDKNNIKKLMNGDIVVDKSLLVRSFKLK